MRAAWLLVVALVAPALAGCLIPERLDAATLQVDPARVEVPEGARLEPIEGGARLLFDAVKLPFERNVTLPEGTTLVRLTAEGAADAAFGVALRNAETGRRRCQTPAVEAWGEPILGSKTCVGLAAVDPLPAVWQVSVTGPLEAKLVIVELLGGPIEGPAAALDLAQLSMPVYELLDTETVKVESFDKTRLHVEVTRPATDARVPTVIVSSPYNHATRMAGLRPSDDLAKDWGARGYAIVVADVRGYGFSEGCVEVWSANEQKDQVALVEWVAAQPWSDGAVGFYGQSYVATTPVAAAVHAPEALKAIIAVAPVINAYDDWHFGGVPNGEGHGSPLGYQRIGGGVEWVPFGSTNPASYVGFAQRAPSYARNVPYATERADNGFCDATLAARANDPRALYDAFYEERNFSARASDVKAAVLYTQGFEDSNVKSSMITHWFNALPAPKLGLFGHWVHQHPPRADQELLFLAWMDQHVRGRSVGVDRMPIAQVSANDGSLRLADAWPPLDAVEERLFLDFGKGTLSRAPAEGYATLQLAPLTTPLPLPAKTTLLRHETTLEAPLRLAGSARVELDAHVEYGENGHVAAFLYDGDRLVTWGMLNLAHREGHDRHVSSKPGDMIRVHVPMLPTEHVFAAGSALALELRGAVMSDWVLVRPGQPAELGLHGGEAGTALVLPTVR